MYITDNKLTQNFSRKTVGEINYLGDLGLNGMAVFFTFM